MSRDLVKNCKGLSGLNACKCCFLRTRWQQSDLLIQHGVHQPLVSVRNFWLFLIVFVPISCFKLVFLWKAIMGCKLLNISLKVQSMLNMCQCLFIISFIFGSTGLDVNENGVVSLCLGLQCFKSNDLSR